MKRSSQPVSRSVRVCREGSSARALALTCSTSNMERSSRGAITWRARPSACRGSCCGRACGLCTLRCFGDAATQT
ncbi:unnamed protein product [Arctia plantaginis]|uniref:Uncharacterized protein n=1 Tax=Arctia plantaginis TaxID=874455 RepID=A0A8S1AD02_ARCPL|nr:unnamed protein product [Arctia plantaginis]